MQHKLDFYTSYNQFYICDKNFRGDTGSDDFWTDDAFSDRLALEDGILGVGTASYGHIRAELDILNKANEELDVDQYDHIVEGGLVIESGVLQVLDCPNSEVELEVGVKPGTYRVKIYSSNLLSADIDENDGDDFYKIEIWPDSVMKREVLKRFSRK